MRSSISCSILIIVFEDDSVFLVNILPSLVQKEFIGRLFLAWFSFCTKYWRWRVRSSVITILSGLFFRLLWLLYILFFIFQFLKRHIICPFPLVIFPIICDRSMSSILSLISCLLDLAVLSFDFSSFLNVRPCFFASLINISWLFLVFCFIHSVVLLLFHIVTPEWCLKDAFLFRLMALSRSPNKCSAERFVVLLWVVCKRSSSVILTAEPLSKWSTNWRLTTLRIMSLSFSSVDLQDSFPSYKN